MCALGRDLPSPGGSLSVCHKRTCWPSHPLPSGRPVGVRGREGAAQESLTPGDPGDQRRISALATWAHLVSEQ